MLDQGIASYVKGSKLERRGNRLRLTAFGAEQHDDAVDALVVAALVRRS
jgi:hypothetical protein